jgi:hypothetical protein
MRMDASAIENSGKELELHAAIQPRALRAIRQANVRFGILPPQSRLRGNDEQERRLDGRRPALW